MIDDIYVMIQQNVHIEDLAIWSEETKRFTIRSRNAILSEFHSILNVQLNTWIYEY